MYPLSSDILSMTDEPAALLLNRRLVFANAAARGILGADCDGKSIRELFGEEVAETQEACFAASVPIGGRNRLLRVSREGNMQVVFFTRPDTELSPLNDAWLQAFRSGLMNLNLAVSAGQRRAEELGDKAMLRSFTGLNREYFRLNRLLANISAASGILAGTLPLTLCAMDLSEMARGVVDSVSLLRPDVELLLNAPQQLRVWADPLQVELMLLNLLSNSLIHAKGLSRIRLQLDPRRDRVFLSVRDDGCGIRPEDFGAVFQRYRAGFDLRELPLGAGLGMTVIRGVAEAHGGTLMLESRMGVGTLVRVSLSRILRGEGRLREGGEVYIPSMERLLTGLATCLPDGCFHAAYKE